MPAFGFLFPSSMTPMARCGKVLEKTGYRDRSMNRLRCAMETSNGYREIGMGVQDHQHGAFAIRHVAESIAATVMGGLIVWLVTGTNPPLPAEDAGHGSGNSSRRSASNTAGQFVVCHVNDKPNVAACSRD